MEFVETDLTELLTFFDLYLGICPKEAIEKTGESQTYHYKITVPS